MNACLVHHDSWRVFWAVCVRLPASSEESAQRTRGLYSGNVINRFCPPTQNRSAWHCRNATGGQAPAMTEQEFKMADSYNTRAFGPKWNSLLPGSPPGLPRLNSPYAYLVFPHSRRRQHDSDTTLSVLTMDHCEGSSRHPRKRQRRQLYSRWITDYNRT